MDQFRCCKLCGEESAAAAYRLNDGQVYRCRNCDFHFLNRLDDIVAIEEKSKGLNEQAWNYIEGRVGEPDDLLRKQLALVKEFVPLDGARCLDLGAGVGQVLLQLKKEKAEGFGIEPSAMRRDYAKRKFGLDLRQELVDDRYWQDDFGGYFDAICLWDVIEHLNDPVATLEQACRLLKSGGYLFIDTPNRAALAYRTSELFYRLSGGQFPLFLENFYSYTYLSFYSLFIKPN